MIWSPLSDWLHQLGASPLTHEPLHLVVTLANHNRPPAVLSSSKKMGAVKDEFCACELFLQVVGIFFFKSSPCNEHR